MKKQESLKKNYLMNIILTASSFIFPIITFPYISRILLPEGLGKISFATSIVMYFSMFAQLGIPTYGIRVCAKVRDNYIELTKTVHELLILNIIMSVISYSAFFITLLYVNKLTQEKPLFLIMGFTIFFNAIGVEWLYKALEKYTYITYRSIIFKFLAVLLMFLYVHEKKDYIVYGAITIFAASASSIFNFINVHRLIGIKPLNGYNLKRHIRPVLVFFAMSCATIIYTNLDNVMLGFIKSDVDVGYYNAAIKIKSILVGVVTSLGTVLLPRASYYIEKGMKEDFYNISKKALNFVIVISIPMLIYFTLFAKEGIFFLSGKAYEGSIMPMQIIMPTILFIGMTNVIGVQMLVPLGKEKWVLYSVVIGAVIDLTINSLLIPRMASTGAAIGTVIAEMTVWIVQLYFIRSDIKQIYKAVNYGMIFAGVLAASLGSLWIKLLHINEFWKLALSSILFFLIYIIVLLYKKEPLAMEIKSLIKNKFKITHSR